MHAWGEDGELAGQHGQLPGFRLAGDARHADDVTPADAGVQLPEAVLVTRVLSKVGYDLARGGRWWCGLCVVLYVVLCGLVCYCVCTAQCVSAKNGVRRPTVSSFKTLSRPPRG